MHRYLHTYIFSLECCNINCIKNHETALLEKFKSTMPKFIEIKTSKNEIEKRN